MEETVRKIRNLLVGTALAGALAAGIAAAPAATASTTATASASQALSTYRFGPYYSGYSSGESSRRSYVTGSWGKGNDGYHYLDFKLFDRDHDRQYTYFDVFYHENGRWIFFKRYQTYGEFHRQVVFDKHGIDGFKWRIGEGTSRDFDWSNWHTVSGF
jgi:hypothetical protein